MTASRPHRVNSLRAHNEWVGVLAMEKTDVQRWFDSYLADFVALYCGDVDDRRRAVLAYWGVPMLFSTDAGMQVLADEAQVLAAAEQGLAGLRAAGVDRIDDVVAAETIILNRSCATHRARFSRYRADGSVVAWLEVTYLITDGPAGRRISAAHVIRRHDRRPSTPHELTASAARSAPGSGT